MNKLGKLSLIAGLIIAFAFTGCNQPKKDVVDDSTNNSTGNTAMNVTKAVAVIHSNSSDISGWVTFTKVSDGVRVEAKLNGLSEGKHGFHIHTYGDCRADDYSSAGGHFNPAQEKHGAPDDSARHMGDMGNISANGTAAIDYVDHNININKIIGRALILHKGTDDLTSQPSGAAGPRIACGVIGYANVD